MTEKRIKDIFPDPLDSGPIYLIESYTYDTDLRDAFQSIPGFESHSTDLVYIQRSGGKRISNLVEYLSERYPSEDYDNPEFRNALVASFLTMYKRKWLKLIETYSIEYNALKPYSMSLHDELVKDHLTSRDVVNRTDNEAEDSLEHGEGNDNSLSHTSGSDSSTNSYYGFNSTTDPVDTDKTVGENAQDSSRQGSTSRDTSSQRSNSRTSVRGDDYARDRESERDITREGNIGNKTNQELITEEREMLRWNVILEIFRDIDKIICAKIW